MRLEPEPEWTLNSGQKVQPKYGSAAGSGSRVEPPSPPQSPKVRHRWDHSQSGS